MSGFSKRYGFQPEKPFQVESMDEELRTGLWNALYIYFWSNTDYDLNGRTVISQRLVEVINYLWVHFFKWPLNGLPGNWQRIPEQIETWFNRAKWYQVYDFIEFIAHLGNMIQSGAAGKFRDFCNQIMEKERSVYRFVGEHIVRITNEVEIEQIEQVLLSPYDPVREQIKSAVAKLAQKPAPDLRNCIKESINAVETAARLASGNPKGTLGNLLPVLKNKLNLHPSQVEGFSKLYGYTCDDESGIRHGMMDKDDLTVDDARYMLVICASFANYILRLAERAGMLKPSAS